MKFIFLFIAFTFSVSLAAQVFPDPPYKRFPTLPPLKLLLVDSLTEFTEKDLKKDMPVFIFLFSPDCDHCQKETEELIDNMDKFKEIQIIMVTAMPFDKMKEFYQQYQLKRFHNLTMGFDKIYLLPTFYRMKNYPFLAFYNKAGKLTGAVEGALPVKKVLEYFNVE